MERANPAVLASILGFGLLLVICLWRAASGKIPYIRRIRGVDAIDEAIGRTVELGRPVIFTSGLIDIGPLLYASLGILHHIARRVAVFGSKIYVPSYSPEVLAITEATLQDAYRSVNRLSKLDPTAVRYLSSEQFAFASGYMGLMHRENVGAAFLCGSFAAESLILAEAGVQVQAYQVAATTSNEQIPFFITSCDYTLFGEELFGAAAYLSKEPVQSGSLRAQDIAKLALAIVVALGIAESTLRSLRGTEPAEAKTVTAIMDATWTDAYSALKSRKGS